MICSLQILMVFILYVILSNILYAVAESQLQDMNEVLIVKISFDIVYGSIIILLLNMFGGVC